MPSHRGRGLAKLWVAAGWPAQRRLHPESISNELQTVASKSRRTSWPRDQPRGQEQASRGIDAPPAQGIERKRKALEQGPDNFSSFRALTTRARRTARRTGLRPLREGRADWSLAWPIGRSRGVCSQSFPRWHNLFLRPDQDRGAQHARLRARLTSARARSATPGRVSGPPHRTTFGGWLVHPRGESRDASRRIKRIGPRPARPPAT